MDIDPAVLEQCDALRLRHSDVKWTLFKITDQRVITIDSTSVCNAFDEDFQKDKDQFLALTNLLEPKEPRYIVYKFSIPTAEGERKDHLAFIYWYVFVIEDFYHTPTMNTAGVMIAVM